ncbi:PREDICTED: uncharacterized protein LOC104591344 [Nelumbo nucifera]|uniref:Uncharacterized protein n=2 Tax=Nelumbo nucifera TaxID=4432 RepID=A0A823A2U3_NELNU|nr:PREDICTED: uncharacterized protein LOC104591344 [Nelumbo nucifera]DAD48408.1 TPA_asm: hypothetical protein HUJ06_018345 [Nelumbo nucifera]
MSGISNLAIGFIVVFALCFVALISLILYVIWYRRRFRQQNSTGEPDFTGDPFASPSKELLYFFCWKNQSRIEPTVFPTSRASGTRDGLSGPVDPLKWHGLYGPPRFLLPIKEDKEDLESQKPSAERKPKKRMPRRLEATKDGDVQRSVEVERDTPFSTPCTSPPYVTPWPSPPREVQRSVEVEDVADLPQYRIRVDLGVHEMQRELPENDFYEKTTEASVSDI